MHGRIGELLASVGLAVDGTTAHALAEFLRLLARWNETHNLTAITEPEAMIRRHLVESLALGPFVRGSRVADVGSGGGLPGIPLAIAHPEKSFTLIESRGKRAGFLRHAQAVLGLENVSVEHRRVEDLRAVPPFDTVLARAVAPLPELLELTAHLFAPDSVLLALTGESFAGDVAALAGGYRARRVGEPMARLFRGSLVIVEKGPG